MPCFYQTFPEDACREKNFNNHFNFRNLKQFQDRSSIKTALGAYIYPW